MSRIRFTCSHAFITQKCVTDSLLEQSIWRVKESIDTQMTEYSLVHVVRYTKDFDAYLILIGVDVVRMCMKNPD